MNEAIYTGRYAPSPSGDLHLGNLRTGLLAWLHARLRNGRFLLRMEDLDTPRVVAGSADRILRDLEWLGLDWDGPVLYQSHRLGEYAEALNLLQAQGLIYSCFCSRKDINLAASAPHGREHVYPGTCRNLSEQERAVGQQTKPPAQRIRVTSRSVEFSDTIHGGRQENLEMTCGDFVVRRADGIFAYQLAVSVDDLAQQISHVVRGNDLLDSTGRQVYLAQCLAPTKAQIQYLHVPLLCNENGQRMAKRDGSKSATEWRSEGGDARQLVQQFAQQLGLAASAPYSPTELLAELTAQQFDHALLAQDG